MATKQDEKKAASAADDAPDTTKSARTSRDDGNKTQSSDAADKAAATDAGKAQTQADKPDPGDVSAKEGEAGKDPMQSGALSTSGPDAVAVVEPDGGELDGHPTGAPPGTNVFPEHTAVEPADAGEYKGKEAPSEKQILAEIFAVIRNELAADKPFLRDRLDMLIGKYTGIDRSSQAD